MLKKLCLIGNQLPQTVAVSDDTTVKSEGEDEGLTSDEDEYDEPDDKPFDSEEKLHKKKKYVF